jgi:hypothetical protein
MVLLAMTNMIDSVSVRRQQWPAVRREFHKITELLIAALTGEKEKRARGVGATP